MAKFNQTKASNIPVQTTHQGGVGVKQRPEYELIGLLATGIDGKFYEKESDREKRIFELATQVAQKDPELFAKMLVYTRAIIGQRTVTHVGAVAAAKLLSGTPVATKLFTKRSRKENKGGVIYRLDDMLEILAYYYMRNPGKPLPNSIRRGFKSVLESADAYELAKYQGKGKEVSLVDLVNLVRPKPSKDMEDTFKKLMHGELKQFNTAEDKQTEAGQKVAAKVKSGEITKAQAEVELKEAKAENWKELVESGKIGYLALLRNLRNITLTASDDVFNAALNMLTNEKRVKESLVFPHQIDIAFETLLNEGNILSGYRKTSLLTAVNTAYELAIPNLREIFQTGRTAVVVDVSGSMTSNANMTGKRINSSAIEKAALVAATLCKGTGADLYEFDNSCRTLSYNPLDSVNTIKNHIVRHATGGGTYFETIFRALANGYDRVFVLSDEQGADSLLHSNTYKDWMARNGRPYIYSVNMCGYSTTMFKESDKVIRLFGYSKDIYEQVKTCELNPAQILDQIRKIEL
jgi:hypothetical protein